MNNEKLNIMYTGTEWTWVIGSTPPYLNTLVHNPVFKNRFNCIEHIGP